MKRYTVVDKVNLRRSAGFGSNIKASLQLAQPVEVTGAQSGDRWMPVRVDFDGTKETGFVSKNVLRAESKNSVEAIVKTSVDEWLKFERGNRKEWEDTHYLYVKDYWKAVGADYDGRDRDVPWSAAFISYVMKRNSGYGEFRYSAAHARYIYRSIQAANGSASHPFHGFDIGGKSVEIGDIVCRWRQRKIDFDFASRNEYYTSHGDIVVGFDKNKAITIGGNVSQSVETTNYEIDDDRFLTGNGNVFAILKNVT